MGFMPPSPISQRTRRRSTSVLRAGGTTCSITFLEPPNNLTANERAAPALPRSLPRTGRIHDPYVRALVNQLKHDPAPYGRRVIPNRIHAGNARFLEMVNVNRLARGVFGPWIQPLGVQPVQIALAVFVEQVEKIFIRRPEGHLKLIRRPGNRNPLVFWNATFRSRPRYVSAKCVAAGFCD